MKLKAILLLSSSFSLVPLVATYAAVLPDACGNEKVSFEIQLQKNSPAPAAPEAGKAQVFFIEKSEKPPAIGCIGCSMMARASNTPGQLVGSEGTPQMLTSVAPPASVAVQPRLDVAARLAFSK